MIFSANRDGHITSRNKLRKLTTRNIAANTSKAAFIPYEDFENYSRLYSNRDKRH